MPVSVYLGAVKWRFDLLIYESPEHGDIYTQLTSPNNLEARAQGLVEAGGAATLQGAKAVLNTTIDLIASHNCE